MHDYNIDRPAWHESHITEMSESPKKRQGQINKLFKLIGKVSTNIVSPIKSRVDTTTGFFIALPNRSSTEAEVLQFEALYITGTELPVDSTPLLGEASSVSQNPTSTTEIA
jgi:hypothetical protein